MNWNPFLAAYYQELAEWQEADARAARDEHREHLARALQARVHKRGALMDRIALNHVLIIALRRDPCRRR